MKNLVKIAAVAVLSLGFGVAAQAQGTPGNASIQASAEVISNVEVIGGLPLVFGQVMPGFNKFISLEGTAADLSAGTVNSTGVSQGSFYVSAAPGSSVILDFDLPVELADGAKKMEIVFNQGLEEATNTIAWVTGTTLTAIPNNQIDGHLIPSFPQGEVNVGTDANPNNKNAITVFVGGMVKPTSTQASGSYVGTISLTAAYN
jgi:hypothetical protein